MPGRTEVDFFFFFESRSDFCETYGFFLDDSGNGYGVTGRTVAQDFQAMWLAF